MSAPSRTLLSRTVFTLGLTMLVSVFFTLAAAVYFVAIPLAKRSADDLAAIIVSAAHTMQSLPEGMQEKFRHQLLTDHGLIVAGQKPALAEKTFDVPYYIFFQEAIDRRAGRKLTIVESLQGPLIWVDVPVGDGMVRIGFDRQRVGANPPVVLLIALVVGVVLTLSASTFYVRRVTRPLARLASAAEVVGHGVTPPALPEEGPAELAALAIAFNRMSANIQALSENRNVIIAGLSHDLRTPLTRLELAIEMLGNDTSSEITDRIRRDLAAMNVMIGQFMQFARGLDEDEPSEIDLCACLRSLAEPLRDSGAKILLHGCDGPCTCETHPLALERVIGNLLENAVHYGDSAPIDVEVRRDPEECTVSICDRGPGIPDDQAEAVFRPFHRLEAARTTRTGGSGLGLAIARQLALKHQWSIQLLPRDGGGTIARVRVPLDPGSRPAIR